MRMPVPMQSRTARQLAEDDDDDGGDDSDTSDDGGNNEEDEGDVTTARPKW